MDWLDRFSSVWSIDFEFSQPPGERPKVACMVAREFHTKRLLRLGMEELECLQSPPFDIGPDSLFVAFFSSAEWGCFLSLGWKLPANVLDLWCELKRHRNGEQLGQGDGSLLGCLNYFGLDSMLVTEKQAMRELAIRGGPYTSEEMTALVDYCQQDVDALDLLLPKMWPVIDFPRAVHRGRYMKAVAHMEDTGVPIDVDTLATFRRYWSPIKSRVIEAVDQDFGVYDGQTFKQDRFAAWLVRNNIPWPTTESGRLALDDGTFRQQAKIFPQVSPLRELRYTLSEMRLEKLQVGSDGRNRTMLRPFASRSGRNQPSNNRFIFGPSVWLRGLIKPSPGKAVAYVDWSQQEFGIAGVLSGDVAMMQAYKAGDPYLAFAKMAGAIPPDGTKETHSSERAAYKQCVLASQFGQKEHGLAARLDKPTAFARRLLRKHYETFATFWKWNQQQVDSAMLLGSMQTVFGWRIKTIGGDNPRSLGNFPMQANGAEMLRLACCLATEAGIKVCCPVHDAIMIEADIDKIQATVEHTQAIMREASRIVLDGFELDSDSEIIAYPHRYRDDDRGGVMWDQVVELARNAALEAGETSNKSFRSEFQTSNKSFP